LQLNHAEAAIRKMVRLGSSLLLHSHFVTGS
jgi:hypothetical protein